MKRTAFATCLAAWLGASTLVAFPAAAAPSSWGQEVKACNLSSCYPEGSRGDYVGGQAADAQGPGYAWEIHELANPGRSDPTLP